MCQVRGNTFFNRCASHRVHAHQLDLQVNPDLAPLPRGLPSLHQLTPTLPLQVLAQVQEAQLQALPLWPVQGTLTHTPLSSPPPCKASTAS